MKLKYEYSFLTGVWKTVKNNLIIWGPAVIALLLNVPPKYTPIASVVVYFLRNLIKHGIEK